MKSTLVRICLTFFAIFTTTFSSAQQSNDAVESVLDISYDSVRVYLSEKIKEINSSQYYQINDQYIISKDIIGELYQATNYSLLWENEENRLQALGLLENTWKDGLIPQDYHLAELSDLEQKLIQDETFDYNDLVHYDLLLTDGILLYAYHLIKGKVHPSTLDVNWNFSGRDLPDDPIPSLTDALEAKSIASFISDFAPSPYLYEDLKQALVTYQEIYENGGWSAVPIEGVLKPGQLSNQIHLLKERLEITGDYPNTEELSDSIYSGLLVEAVKSFQVRHGLNDDGIIGKQTIEALNVPVEDKINKLRMSLERARWVMEDIGDDMILVNVADYKLFYIEDAYNEYETKVMVGTYYHKTPIFTSKMKYLVFNPTWTVPYSIASKEILPKLKKDPNYLVNRNMTLLNASGKAINSTEIDWSKYSRSQFPFTIRQEPGPGNALGQVKFIFPNKYAVYLHDTPSKYLFEKDVRAFSHGCIRVQNPLKLAEVLLNDEKWNQGKIQEVLDTKKETFVHFKKPKDVLLLYWTAGLLKDGRVFFRDDVYKRDDAVLAGLNSQDWKSIMDEYYADINE